MDNSEIKRVKQFILMSYVSKRFRKIDTEKDSENGQLLCILSSISWNKLFMLWEGYTY